MLGIADGKSSAQTAWLTSLLPCDDAALEWATSLLAMGEVVAVPTETVYGLAAVATRPSAVARIYEVKGRPAFNPLIVHVARDLQNVAALDALGYVTGSSMSSEARKTADRLISVFWPGALTIVMPRGPTLPDIVAGGLRTIGLRMPAHPSFLDLLDRIGEPLAAPSANRSNRISPTQPAHVMSELGGRIPLILDGGPATVGVESTIVDIMEDGALRLLRAGGVSLERLANTIRGPISRPVGGKAPLAPGMLREHYAPAKPLLLVPRDSAWPIAAMLEAFGKPTRIGVLLMSGPPVVPLEWGLKPDSENQVVVSLDDSGQGEAAARGLFSVLRALDDSESEVIIAELPPSSASGLWPAIADRLTRAGARWNK